MRIPVNDLQRVNAPHAAAFRAAYGRVVGRGVYVLGEEVLAFEREFSAYCGAAHCVTVANGSDALEISLRAIDVQAGDKVATVANAAMYATLAIRAIGAVPVYVEVDERTLTMSPSALADVANTTLRAVVVTHLYGRLADMASILGVARNAAIPVIEDSAQAHGAQRSDTRAGAFGTAACFSFYPTKNLGALGDGGAIITSDPAVAERARSLRQYGWSAKYRVGSSGGRNSRLDELQAAFLRARLPSLDGENARRRVIHNTYVDAIRHTEIRPPERASVDHVAHLAVVRTPARESLRAHLQSRRIATDVHYPIADHLQPVAGGHPPALAVTERACDEVLSLPCFPGMSDEEIHAVVDACNDWRC